MRRIKHSVMRKCRDLTQISITLIIMEKISALKTRRTILAILKRKRKWIYLSRLAYSQEIKRLELLQWNRI